MAGVLIQANDEPGPSNHGKNQSRDTKMIRSVSSMVISWRDSNGFSDCGSNRADLIQGIEEDEAKDKKQLSDRQLKRQRSS